MYVMMEDAVQSDTTVENYSLFCLFILKEDGNPCTKVVLCGLHVC